MSERFFEWDYRTGLVTEFARNGECKRCGACCHAFIAFKADCRPYKGDVRNGAKSMDESGVWQEASRGRWRFFYQMQAIRREGHRCQACGEENLCNNQEDKPGICRDWPMSPTCTAQFADCGFSFAVIGTWKIEDLEVDGGHTSSET